MKLSNRSQSAFSIPAPSVDYGPRQPSEPSKDAHYTALANAMQSVLFPNVDLSLTKSRNVSDVTSVDLSSKSYLTDVQSILHQFGKNVILLPQSDHVRVLQTVIRNKEPSRNDFLFHADRLIRLVVEEGLNQLPYAEVTVTTPTGHLFRGVKFLRGNCGVSVVRSGEAMERGLRDCCRSIRIGKILIQAPDEGPPNDVKLYYAKLPPNISQRKVLLMYPILGTGNTILKALDVLRSYDVPMENVIVLTLFASPEGLRSVLTRNPAVRVVTSEVHPVIPTHFVQRYFGTD